MTTKRTPARSASEERHEIKRFVERALKKTKSRVATEYASGAHDAFNIVLNFIDGMAERDNRKPGGAGKKKR